MNQVSTQQPQPPLPPPPQQQQLLWRPSEEVLHFLTECRPATPALAWSNEVNVLTIPSEVPRPPKIRQAPTVWKPPSAMKAITRPPEPLSASEVQAEKLASPPPPLPPPPPALINCYAVERIDEELVAASSRTVLMPPPREPAQENRSETVLNGLSGSMLIKQQQNPFSVDATNSDSCTSLQLSQQATTTSSTTHLAGTTELVKQNVGPAGLKQSLVAQTTLFSGLASVSFRSSSSSSSGGTPALAPASVPASIAQAPLFSGLGTVSFTTPRTTSTPPTQPSIFAESAGFGALHQQQQTDVRLSSTTSASEKGSSSSQAADVPGFRPSELQGKSLLITSHSGAEADTTTKPAGSLSRSSEAKGRKLRTRPLETLMKLPPDEQQQPEVLPRSSKTGAVTRQAAAAAAAAAAGADLPPVVPRRKKQQEQQREPSPKAYFAHTKAWIVQKKSTRRAVSKFGRRVDEPTTTRGGSKKRSLTAMSNDQPKRISDKKPQQQQQSSDRRSEKQPPMDKRLKLPDRKGHRPQPEKKSIDRKPVHRTKQPAKHHQDRVKQTEAKAKPQTKLKKSRMVVDSVQQVRDQGQEPRDQEPKDDDHSEPEEDDEETEDDEAVVAARAAAEPLIRSKRGRNQALPTRLRDSVINKVKKRSRKQ